MLKIVRNVAMTAMLAIGGFIAAATTSYAQQCHCEIVDGCKVVTFDNGDVIVVCPSTGTGDFNCNLEFPPQGPIDASFPPVSIEAVGQSDQYGLITTKIDLERTASDAFIRSNTEKERFPATVQFSFYARTTIEGRDGEYCSREELVFVNDNVNSFQPFEHEKFCLAKDVEFVLCEDLENPDAKVAFTLHAGETCVTLN